MKKNCKITPIDPGDVKSRMLVLRNQPVLLDRDVATLYGVETKHVNQAVRNNPGRFPIGYLFQLSDREFSDWRSKILTSNIPNAEKYGIKRGLRYAPVAFTERGLYMLATVLKSKRAEKATLAIIEAYAKLREMVSDMEELQTKKAGTPEQMGMLAKIGQKFAELIDDNLTTKTVETEIELNLSMIKIRRKITRTKHVKQSK